MKSVRTYLTVFVVFSAMFMSCAKDELKDLHLKQSDKSVVSTVVDDVTDSDAQNLDMGDGSASEGYVTVAGIENNTVAGGHDDGSGSTGEDPGGVVGGDENEGDDDGDGIIGGDENDGDDDDEVIGGTTIVVGKAKGAGEIGG